MIRTQTCSSRSNRLLAIGTILIGGLLTTTASATPITAGQANFGGIVDVTLGGLFFSNTNDTAPQTFDGGTGTGAYSGLNGGTIQNLVGPPVTGPISIVDFATFLTTIGTIHFDLQNIFPGVGTAANCGNNSLGSQCTPAGSPFTLTQNPTGVGITLNLSGIAYLPPSSSGSTPTTGLFTAQVQVPGTITSVLQAVQTTGLLNQSYSANFTSTPASTVPEPGSLSMLGAGVGLLAIGIARKRTRATQN
jgi:hypothetical protein